MCSGVYCEGEDAGEAERGRGGRSEVGRAEGWKSCGTERIVRFLATVEVEVSNNSEGFRSPPCASMHWQRVMYSVQSSAKARGSRGVFEGSH